MNRIFLASLSLPLIACYGGERRNTGECPAGEVCSDLTPRGLDFVGNSLIGELLLSGPRATAIGGTQTVALEYDRGDGLDVALDLPFTADDDGGIGVKVEGTSGSQVTVRGAGSRTNYLRILDQDGFLMDRKELTGASITLMELVAAEFEKVPEGMQLAFAGGPTQLGVALYGDVQTDNGPRAERLIDTSMELTLSGATRKAWDSLELDASTPGTYPLSVTAGDKPAASIDIVVVQGADALSPIEPVPTTIMTNGGATICFAATSGARYVAGLEWSYNVDGEMQTKGDGVLTRNCVSVTTAKTSGTVAITASAGGQTAAIALTVGAARELPVAPTPTRAMSHAIPTAGDRAAM